MSAVIKTTTPFVLESVLFTALEASQAEPVVVTKAELSRITQRNQIMEGDIMTNRSDYNGRQFFRQQDNRWILLHDGDEYRASVVSQLVDRRYTPVSRFLADLSLAYDVAYKEHLELIAENERIRLEQERIARVEGTRQRAIEKAKSKGYTVKEGKTSTGQIQLVLTRTV